MKVLNVHEREFQATPEQVGELVDSLASAKDALWPRHSWPPMDFNRPLGVGATGGHGPIRYSVEEYTRGQTVKFRFAAPKGFDGFHCFEVVAPPGQTVRLRHTIEMNTRGLAVLLWPLVIRPLHDALIEDAFATADASLGLPPRMKRWPLRVRALRWMMSGGRRRPQVRPKMVEAASPSAPQGQACRNSQT